jgi:hypothetical protein
MLQLYDYNECYTNSHADYDSSHANNVWYTISQWSMVALTIINLFTLYKCMHNRKHFFKLHAHANCYYDSCHADNFWITIAQWRFQLFLITEHVSYSIFRTLWKPHDYPYDDYSVANLLFLYM